MAGEKFCLKWNEFQSNVATNLRQIRDDRDFFDVTLACEGEDQVEAHKVVLAVCSPFFRSVLQRNRHDHPLIYLKGVSFMNLTAVLNFMYHGEVNVAQEDLNNFLQLADELKIKGLSQQLSSSSDQKAGATDGREIVQRSAVGQSSKHSTQKIAGTRVRVTTPPDLMSPPAKRQRVSDVGDKY